GRSTSGAATRRPPSGRAHGPSASRQSTKRRVRAASTCCSVSVQASRCYNRTFSTTAWNNAALWRQNERQPRQAHGDAANLQQMAPSACDPSDGAPGDQARADDGRDALAVLMMMMLLASLRLTAVVFLAAIAGVAIARRAFALFAAQFGRMLLLSVAAWLAGICWRALLFACRGGAANLKSHSPTLQFDAIDAPASNRTIRKQKPKVY
uniref:Transmembrane protein n=1 Tax=Macrostomum lignano TaxID=282301 RepID=A0A1I8FKC4_9PLAT